ncbi:MAG: 2-amino-4-hydroxy-6-hydroxymethyldihydropteridine diphosphokinase [Bacteroidota bacterium]
MERVFLALGSNVGDRLEFLQAAVREVGGLDGVHVSAAAPVYETEPVGVREQSWFLNTVVEIETTVEPGALLRKLKALERRIGRSAGKRWGPREIDIDVILYGSRLVRGPDFEIPHREFRIRRFVLVPLADLAGDVIDPASGKTIVELLARLDDPARVHPTPHRLMISTRES